MMGESTTGGSSSTLRSGGGGGGATEGAGAATEGIEKAGTRETSTMGSGGWMGGFCWNANMPSAKPCTAMATVTATLRWRAADFAGPVYALRPMSKILSCDMLAF